MKLTRFRVQKYKCILDSGWVRVSNLTVLVGKNEAGKTSLLEALNKFNPFNPEPYSIPRDWPRGLRSERSDVQAVCTAEFVLSSQEIQALQSFASQPLTFDHVQVTRDYAARFEVQLPNGLFAEKPYPSDIGLLCDTLPKPASQLDPEFREEAEECRREAIRFLQEGRFSDLAILRKDHAGRLSVRSNHNPEGQNEKSFRDAYLAKLSELSQNLQGSGINLRKAQDFIIQHLPAFVYIHEYQAFCGSANLATVKRRKDQGDLQPCDETFLTILKIAGLDFEKEHTKAGDTSDEAREERHYDLSDAEATLNRKIEGHWGQLRYHVHFRADGFQFMTFVKGQEGAALIPLEYRSKGFQWFFSFDLMLMHQTRGKLKDCVILLDEPGLHLHPEGQRDLLGRLSEYAAANTLIYTTHLPFMLDLEQPGNIRILVETEKGTIVSEDLATAQSAARLVLESALGVGVRASWLVAERNLVLQDPDDYWIISELSSLFRRTSKEGLPAEVLVTPAAGPREATFLAAFMAGQELEVVALFHSDQAGQSAREKLVKAWLPNLRNPHATVLDLATAVGKPGQELAIEELFPEKFYLDHVQQAFEKEFPAGGIFLSPLPPGDLLAKRVETAFSNANVPFDKTRVCKRIAAHIRQMKTPSELPEPTRLMAEQLFSSLGKVFSKV
jgi:predicted ATPase